MSDFSIAEAVHNAFQNHAIVDIHTHLYPASMGELYLAGPDELLTYHYLKAECSRMLPEGVAVDTFNNMPAAEQADMIWQQLFVGNSSPISEAQLGVVTVMNRLGLNPRAKDLSEFRAFHNAKTPEEYTDMVFESAGVACVYMTNDPLDDTEGPMWQQGVEIDPRFRAVLRLDSALIELACPRRQTPRPGIRRRRKPIRQNLCGTASLPRRLGPKNERPIHGHIAPPGLCLSL